MRRLITMIGVLALAGCAGKAVDPRAPLDATTAKSAESYAQCLEPKWAAFKPGLRKEDTENGYKLTVEAAYSASPAWAQIDRANEGAHVRVFLPPEWAGTNGWTDMAKDCL
ncbi:hypothetical protein [Pseudomonas sp. RIT-PI-S]|uniref:hypothetical protein n=1 Tax=Pseudomonas sp. RIT-PI-S TaxID=3035295 RepID=UPI0021D7DFBC|nr:hypothetical protein [Pseudomonas sp. RIT-PI-S]